MNNFQIKLQAENQRKPIKKDKRQQENAENQ